MLRSLRENEDEEHTTKFSNEEIQGLEPFARAMLGTRDSKFDSLVEMLRHLFGEVGADRAMVFSTFRGTLRYLSRRLRDEEHFTLEVMHGGIPPREEDCRKGEKSREKIALEFRRGDFQLLLASEVAGEGLDFEHCHVVINYDLPWNPMRVEQRIGRVDRIGQRSQKIYIGSLASVGTIEGRILARLYERLNVFERALGEMELILGEQIASFERDVFSTGLTPRQQEERLDRIAQAVANIDQQKESISKSSDDFLAGRRLLETDQLEIKVTESRFLANSDIAEFVTSTLERNIPHMIKSLAKENAYEIISTKELIEALQGMLRAYPQSHSARTEIVRFSKHLEDQGSLKISFNAEKDDSTGGEEFVHIRHPLVLLARWLDRQPLPDTPICRWNVKASSLSSPTLIVWCIGSLEGYTSRVELLWAAVDYRSGIASMILPEQASKLLAEIRPLGENEDSNHYDAESIITKAENAIEKGFNELTNSVKSRNSVLSEKAKRAIQSQAQRKLEWLQKQLSRPELNENIRNLYRGWASRLESETQAKMREIDEKSELRTSLQVIGAAICVPASHE